MWTKTVEVGRGQYQVTKKVLDWESIFATAFWMFIALGLLSMCSQG